MDIPEFFHVGSAIDDRGELVFNNDMPFDKIKRMYIVENFNTNTVRAFHGHEREEKYVQVISGSAIFVIARMLPKGAVGLPLRFVLSDRNPRILRVPVRHLNGFRALEHGTKIAFFSTATLAESAKDDIRLPHDYLGKNLWKVESR